MKTQKPIFVPFGIAIVLGLGACSSETNGRAAEPAEVAAKEAQKTVVDVTVAEAKALIDGEASVIVLDVRTPEEFAESHIEGALNVDFRGENFAEELAKLDRDQRYIVHCRSGRRSSASMKVFKELGFTDIQHMFEGFNGWQEADLPTTQ